MEQVVLEKREKLLDDYKTRIRDLKSKVSELRKAGKDPLIADAKLRNVESKMKYALHSGHTADFVKIENTFNDVKQELEEAEGKEVLNVKQEVINRFEKKMDLQKKEEAAKPEAKTPEKKSLSVKDMIEEVKEEAPKVEAPKIKHKTEIVVAGHDQCFHFRDGTCLHSISELLLAMIEMPDDDYNYHTRPDHKDFGNWLAGVFGEEELGKKLKEAKSRKERISLLIDNLRGE